MLQKYIPLSKALLIVVAVCISTGVLVFIFRSPVSLFIFNTAHSEKLALRINPDDPDLLYLLGNHHFGGNGDYNLNTSQAYFFKAVQLRPDFPEAHYQLGRVYFIQGKFSLALHNIREVIRLKPDFEKSYYMYGLINGYSGDHDKAIWGFTEFIQRDDFNWAGYNDLAWVYFKIGDFEKTREIAHQGLRQAPNNAWLHNIYGLALMNLGLTDDAKNEFQLALEGTDTMTSSSWGGAYPGNNPAVYEKGFEEMKSAIRKNLELATSKRL